MKEYKVGNNDNIANIVCLWKTQKKDIIPIYKVVFLAMFSHK